MKPGCMPRPVPGLVKHAGLHVKIPFIQVVHRFDKRWLEYDGDATEIPTRDKKYIWVDTYARWRIADPLRFYQAVRDERGAQTRLDDIVDGETRNAVASYYLIEIVRSSNRAFQATEELEGIGAAEAMAKVGGGNEWLGLCVDTGWFGTQAADVPGEIRAARKWIRHTHIKDVKAAGAHATCLLGEGVVQVADCLAALREIGYRGWYSWEDEPEDRNPFDSAMRNRQWLEARLPN